MTVFHDYKLHRFDWHLSDQILRLELQEPLSEKTHVVEFSGVSGWHLDDAAEGCIVFSLTEIDTETYLNEDARYVRAMQRRCYSTVVDELRNHGARVWSLEASYGLYGYIIARDINEQH